MFETSKDILNLVLALSIVGISVFVCWLLYYLIASMKKLHDVVNLFQKTLTSANELVNNAKKKLKDSSTHLKLIGMLVQKIVEEVQDRSKKGRSKKDRSKKRKSSVKKNTKNKTSKK
jgi:Na+-transporting methylmalonyl-CoA/oxaloacetate decarboxylase gamma subunit